MNESSNQSQEAPEDFVCPITNEIMQDPVLSKYGHSYERSAIVEWLAAHSNTCPLTRRTMHLSDLITHPTLRAAIRQWQIENQEDVTVLGPDVEPLIVGYFDLPHKSDQDDTERTESSDSETGAEALEMSRRIERRRRQRRHARAVVAVGDDTQRERQQQRLNASANRRTAQTILDNHRRRILSYLRPNSNI
ncbi:hypothetical protein MPSEU_001003700 [Mayamaea pseudoterrestris]|nr:hypothetical protein MPSEU_001003700 [Mayamaea pseudoterrestris]